MKLASPHKKRRLVFQLALFFMGASLVSQTTGQAYFQQEVNYRMRVRLNDSLHTLSAFQEIQYINRSPQELAFIYFHLWPNAYKHNGTALAKQLLEQRKTAFYYSAPEERGYIDSLDFKVNGQAVVMEMVNGQPDICRLLLNGPLKPMDTLLITTPFFVKIPDAKFSRLGHVQQSYFITQWYPKPAVFDQDGWHPMPYLDQGEFYSEFGSFDVSVTLPENYLLAATGDRIDAEAEEDFLNKNVIETINRIDAGNFRENDTDFPRSSGTFKTVRFRQYRVHDFAWFADKRFNVVHDQIELPGTRRKVDTWVFFTNKNFKLWKDAINYVNESTLFYSYLNGDYPYNHVTAVDGTIMAGGGMEYPNITVIGDMDNAFNLDVTIAHEVGHNWFYGILGSNERDHPFLDEGINSFYEMRYVRAKYPARKLTDFIAQDSTFRLLGMNKTAFWREKEFTYFLSAKGRLDQRIDQPSQNFTPFNYGSIVYGKTPVVLDYLMDYMGEENFDKAMRFYYEQYRFKHPTPNDFIKTMSYFSGKDLAWLRHRLLGTDDLIDFKLKKVKRNADSTYTLKIKNKTGVPAPVNIYGFKNNKPVGVVWYDGFDKKRRVTFPKADVDYFKIDGLDRMPDINRRNNSMRAHGIFRKAKPLQLNLLTKLENPAKTQVNYVPMIGANFYNGFMLGAALHNYGFYPHRFEYLVAPMYAFKTKTPAGFLELNYNIYPDKVFQQITLGVKGKSFAYDQFDTRFLNEALGTDFSKQYYHYYKIAPYVEFEIKKKRATSPIQQLIRYTNNNLFTDSLDAASYPTIAASGPRKKNVYSFVNSLSYQLANRRAVDPFKLLLNLQHTAAMAKVSATFHYQVSFTKRYFMEIRAFAGAFLSGSINGRAYYSFRTSGYKGPDDYTFDGNYAARNEWSGFGYSQFMEQDANMKVPVLFGYANKWMVAVNIKSPRLGPLPLKAFLDVATSDLSGIRQETLLWDAGINLTLVKDIIEVYVPLLYSNDIRETLDLNNIGFANRLRFVFNLHKIVARDLIKNNFTE